MAAERDFCFTKEGMWKVPPQPSKTPTWSPECDVSPLASLIAHQLCQMQAVCPAKGRELLWDRYAD